MTTEKFHELYGDSFISGKSDLSHAIHQSKLGTASGFIEGGDLHGIISIKVLDSSRKSEIKSA
jgi:hypothetical protein